MRNLWVMFAAALVVVFATVAAVLVTPAQAQSRYPGYPWQCSVSGLEEIAATCMPAPEPGLRRYVTEITAQTSAGVAAQFLLRHGTFAAASCDTGTTSLFPSAASVVRIGAPVNTSAPTVISFVTPLVIPPGKDLCVVGTAGSTLDIQIGGYSAP